MPSETPPVAWHSPELNEQYPKGAYKDEEGNLYVWVDPAPDHSVYGDGFFEAYSGNEADYEPQRGLEPEEDGYLDYDAAEAALND